MKYKLLKDTPIYGDNAEVVVDGYEIEDYDWSDTSEIEEELV